MAEISFKGFVEEWTKNSPQHPAWGMRVTESHSKKDESGQWVNTGYTNRTVKTAYGVEIDFTQFAKGDLIQVAGTEVTETSEKDGKKYSNLIVKATAVTLVPRLRAVPDVAPVDEPF